LYCRANPDLRTFTAAEALRWLMQHIQQQEAKQTLALLQQTHQISVVDKELDLSANLSEADLSATHLQLVSAAPVPKFGQPLNKHYTW
jgi:type III secretory pathway lipoprotein EscJ